ncbi:hypothetical protein Vretifemale_2881 [Volvox reticuliferus]|uniref:Uncharacterized protein n=1 Tax=Volvox reticuliferus TaxID=1737510 RepID=A0A8J4FE61_9CHLO|nr:hypothetical protein Vretifemale_2881 [Volvox reticuliferus]
MLYLLLSPTHSSMLAGLLRMLARLIGGNACFSWLAHPSSATAAGCPTLQARAPPPLASGGIATPEAPTSLAYVPSHYARGPIVQNYLVPNATEAAGMAAAAATTDAAAVGTSAGLSVHPHTGHEDEVMKMMIPVPKLNIYCCRY